MTTLRINGESIEIGGNGVTFTPSVSEDGVLSWTNDGGLPNPEPVNIKGPQGSQGAQGPKGQDGTNATINGQNTLTIAAGQNVSLSQSGSTLTISAQEVYVTNETRIGTWIDGKPIYRRVFQTTLGTASNGGYSYVNYDPSSIDTLVFMGATCKSSPNYHLGKDVAYVAYGYNFSHTDTNDTDYFTIYLSGNDKRFGIIYGKYQRGGRVHIIIEYTKTTDQATVQTTAAIPANLTVEPAAATAVESKITF